MKKNIFVVLKDEHIDITYNFIKNKNLNSITIYAPEKLERNIFTNFKDIEFKFVSLTAEYSEEPVEWFKKWYSKPIQNGKNFKELMEYDGKSLHWMFDTWLYYGDFYFKNVPQILGTVNDVNTILQNLPDVVFFVDDKSDFSKLLKKTCILKGIKYDIIKLSILDEIILSFKRIIGNVKPFLRIFAKFGRYISRGIYWRYISFRYNTHKDHKNKKKIFLAVGDRWGKTYNITYKKWINGNEHFDNLISELYKRGYFINFEDISASTNICGYAKEKIERKEFEYCPYEGYINLPLILSVLFEALQLRRKYLKILENENFRNSFNYSGINFYEIIKPKFSFMFSMFMIECLFYLKMSKRIIEVNMPDILVVSGETNPIVRPLIWEAKKNKIPVISIQHGLMVPEIPDYNHLDEDILGKFSVPIPDRMLVYGNHHRNLLEKYSKFPNNILVVTGAPRYDSLVQFNKIFDKKKIVELLDCDPNKNIICWLTDAMVIDDTIKAVFTAIKNISGDLQLRVKLHPGEYDDQKYKNIANEIKLDVKILRDFNVYEIIYASDLVIMGPSTSVIETAILGKPIIMIPFKGFNVRRDIEYAIEGCPALKVYAEEDLIINIKKALYNKETQEKLKKARENFVYENAYLQDGKATERVCNLIEELINKNE